MRAGPTSRRAAGTASRLHPRDLVSEALAGLLQRPGRSALTMLGTVLGIGGFVAIVGLSQTASGQIGSTFNRLDATQVTVADTAAGKAAEPTLDFRPAPTRWSTASTVSSPRGCGGTWCSSRRR
jgi:putative ABC transport system permease protein